MFERTDESLHIELGVDFVGAEVGEADFDFVAELSGFFFCLRDTSFIAFGDFDGLRRAADAALGRLPECGENLTEPREVDASAEEAGFFAGFNSGNPFVGGVFVPVVGDWAGEDLNPEFFVMIGVELSKGASDAGERVNFEGIEGFNWKR